MLDGIVRLIIDHGVVQFFAITMIIIVRPLGLLFGFSALTWALKSTLMIRLSMAVALALPTLVVFAEPISTLTMAPDVTVLMPVMLKEIGIGYALGLLASLPFFAMQYAGDITDGFRGEQQTGLTDANGESLHSFSLLYLVIGYAEFFYLGGFWFLVGNLYDSYSIWPINAVFPTLSLDAAQSALAIFTDSLVLAIQIALPLLVVLFIIEFSIQIAARIAQKYNFGDMSFATKNLAALVLLPVLVWMIWSQSESFVERSLESLKALQVFLE